MEPLNELEIGVMFWAGRDPRNTIREVKSLGVRCGQLGIPGDLDLEGQADEWCKALRQEDFRLVTVFCAFSGESYADEASVRETVGFIPPATREQREHRMKEVSDFAARIGVKSIATHIGFVPESQEDTDYRAVCSVVRRICDHAAQHGQTFCLETGQESADALLQFVKDVDRRNLGINFDPANMIMYGTGDPIQALGILSSHILSVHCKDGEWPVKDAPGALGVEKPLGEGAVGMDQFVNKLKQLGYTGTLNIEREIDDQEQRKKDIRMGVELLERLRA